MPPSTTSRVAKILGGGHRFFFSLRLCAVAVGSDRRNARAAPCSRRHASSLFLDRKARTHVDQDAMRVLTLCLLLVACGSESGTDPIRAEPEALSREIAPVELRGGIRLATVADRNVGLECVVQPDRTVADGFTIGPLRIPAPPAELQEGRRQAWRARLNERQSAYVDECCSRPEHFGSWLCSGPETPLVLAFSRDAISFVNDGRSFPFRMGEPHVSDWPTSETPWLAFDRNGDGIIDRGGELFGSGTMLASGGYATNGFQALRELDVNGDGRIDAQDPSFGSLLVWADRDGDRRSSPEELVRASGRILWIDLRVEVTPRCDGRGNCEGERASFHWNSAGGAPTLGTIVDVYLPRR